MGRMRIEKEGQTTERWGEEGETGEGRIWHVRQATQISSAILSRQRRDIASRRTSVFRTAKAPSRIFSTRGPRMENAEWRTQAALRNHTRFSNRLADYERMTRDNQDFLTRTSLSHLYVSSYLAERVKDRHFLRLPILRQGIMRILSIADEIL